MSRHIAVRNLGSELEDIADHVTHTGEAVVLERDGRELAAVVSLTDLEWLQERAERDRTERQRLLDELVRMDDEEGLYAREAEEARRASAP